MEPITLSSQIIALIGALTVGIPTEALDDLPGNFAAAAVREVAQPLDRAVTRLRDADLISPAAAAALHEHVQDTALVGRAVIAATVRTPVTIRAVPQLIHEDLAAGTSLPRAVGEAADDVAAAVRQGNRDVVRALHLARQDTSVLSAQAARKNGAVLSGQGEVRQAPAARAQVPKVTVRGWDPKAVRAEVRAAVRENRAKVAQAVRNVRAAIRDAVRHRADAEA